MEGSERDRAHEQREGAREREIGRKEREAKTLLDASRLVSESFFLPRDGKNRFKSNFETRREAPSRVLAPKSGKERERESERESERGRAGNVLRRDAKRQAKGTRQ